MGYAKYFEDDQDIVIARTEHIHAVSIAPVPVPHYVCPYCNQVEYSQLKLFNHIKAEHNITHPVIIINGKVVNEPEYNVARIDELRVFTYGFADKISLSQKQFLQSETASVDLTMEAQEALDAETSVELRVGERSLFIKKFSVKELRNEKINPIIREWEKSVAEGVMISFTLSDDLNGVEKEYLKGFYNYFLACISEGKDRTNRYYDAYNILNGFNPISSLGICALKAIAFNFNWIDSLKVLCKLTTDEFNTACDFYDSGDKKISSIIFDYKDSLYIEDSIRENLDAISNFMFGNFEDVNEYLSQNRLEEIGDPNQKDRLLVLMREMYLINGDTRKSRYYDEKILSPKLKKKKS